ncbi:hypothetical protein E2562_008692 [Oryza meyeriana var. granulata]|uniref:Uncharacterized protein n=1 Tax=Oryza meyeriana var. granulata TaxID=110450 RepID=A0A6G1F5L2_9ORYZ|nr:hypothetical protein E2562_008692 [Oryza meyeriana var. granulata]
MEPPLEDSSDADDTDVDAIPDSSSSGFPVEDSATDTLEDLAHDGERAGTALKETVLGVEPVEDLGGNVLLKSATKVGGAAGSELQFVFARWRDGDGPPRPKSASGPVRPACKTGTNGRPGRLAATT